MTFRASLRILVVAAGLALCATDSLAVFSVTEPWVRAAPDGRNAEAFMKLRSSDPATIVGVDSFAARAITMQRAGERRPLPRIELPADALVELKPDGTHLRMTGLVRRLKLGEHVPLTLILRAANGAEQKMYVNAEVRHRSPTEDELGGHAHGAHQHAR